MLESVPYGYNWISVLCSFIFKEFVWYESYFIMFVSDIFNFIILLFLNHLTYHFPLLAGEGSFLVRQSENYPGDYSLFFLCEKDVRRFRIERRGNQFLVGGRLFDR